MDNIDLDIEALRKAKESLQKSYSVYQEGNDEPEMCSIYADSCVKDLNTLLKLPGKL